MKHNFYSLEENDKIMRTIERVLGATSRETAVSLEEVIEKGIELGITETYPRGKADGHPWYPRTSVMMGVGSFNAVVANEEKHLHRAKMRKEGGRAKMYYWVDRTRNHEMVRRDAKASGKMTSKTKMVDKVPETVINESKVAKGIDLRDPVAKFNAYEAAYPGLYNLCVSMKSGELKVVSKAWINANPDKFTALYGGRVIR